MSRSGPNRIPKLSCTHPLVTAALMILGASSRRVINFDLCPTSLNGDTIKSNTGNNKTQKTL